MDNSIFKENPLPYLNSHVDKLDFVICISLLTGISLASRQISEENSRFCGCDLMKISAHSGAKPSHASWQGQIVSLFGRRGYLSKSDIGYGTGVVFSSWNFRHDWYPFYEGISTRNYTKSDLDKLNAKDIEYNGKIKDKSSQIQEFCNQTGYNRDRFWNKVSGKTSVGHATGNYQNGLISIQSGGKLNIGRENENNSSNIGTEDISIENGQHEKVKRTCERLDIMYVRTKK